MEWWSDRVMEGWSKLPKDIRWTVLHLHQEQQ